MDTKSLRSHERSFAARPVPFDYFLRPTFLASYLRPARLEQKIEPVRDKTLSAAVIFSPVDEERVRAGRGVVEGFAVAGIGKELERVELSLDGGRTWVETELSDPVQPGQWRRWRKLIRLAPGQYKLVVRAVDTTRSGTASDLHNTWHGVCIEVI